MAHLYTATKSSNWTTKLHTIEEIISAAMLDWRVPGVAFGLNLGEDQYWAGFGITDTCHPLFVSSNTLFQIGSITKTFTATAALQLIAAGYLQLDELVKFFLPDFQLLDPTVTAQVTIRHLLTHTGGWQGDFFEDTGSEVDALKLYVEKMRYLPQITPPGLIWSYNNAGYNLLGRVLEVATGQPYSKILQEEVFDKLGLKSTFLPASDTARQKLSLPLAIGHAASSELDLPVPVCPSAVPPAGHPAGGIISNIVDLLNYAKFHSNTARITLIPKHGSKDIQDNNIHLLAMYLPYIKNGPDALSASAGWQIKFVDRHKIISHGGVINGFGASLQLIPTADMSFVILTNSYQGSSLCEDVVDFILEEYLKIKKPEIRFLVVSHPQLLEYTGQYVGGMMPLSLIVQKDELILIAYSGEGQNVRTTTLGFTDIDRVIALEGELAGIEGDFLRADSQVVWFRFGGRVAKKVSV